MEPNNQSNSGEAPLDAENAQPAPHMQPTQPVADDDDAIETEWIDKAKQIIERNRDDPHKMSEEMMLFRADYMKKRYGKIIKVD